MTIIRAEAAADIPAIDGLLRDCFDGGEEAELVAELRKSGDLSLSLVAEAGGEIIGHIAFSPLRFEDRPDARFHALAPLAVAEGFRCNGLAARLAESGLAHFRETGADGVIVLGNPAYYRRFGFSPGLASDLNCDWSGPYLQALLFDRPLTRPAGKLSYAAAFNALS